jgi:hypothetical protein
MPVGIEYCGHVLNVDGNYITNREFEDDLNYLNDATQSLENFDKNCYFHASAVIGQTRKADGKCYFEIQDSQGKSCDGRGKHACDKAGHVWVSADVLSANIVRIDSF